jgi:cation-transporting P-type ATPase C
MLPEDKALHVARLTRSEKTVAMVGDGINDAPALAEAEVGIAMGAGGAEAAVEAADIALVDDRLERIVFVRRLGHQTLRIIAQNHWFAVLTDLAGAVVAVAGLLPPVLSGAAHIGHTVVLFANSSRLMSYQPDAHDACGPPP